jgi:UDP-N-acetylmuramoyl-L-alanyl-D-glutamate--2,6-diaminopimelate ligase
MLLNELLKAIQPVQVTGDSRIEITGVNIDSRLVEAGQLFMAMRGTQTDGHAYIPAAIQKGATAILCEDLPEEPVAGITYIQVKDSEDAVGKIATTFYGNPTSQFELVGVTGTNGKTTIATLLYNTFRYFGYKVGLISTVCNYIDDQPIPTEHTTPDPITLNRVGANGRRRMQVCLYGSQFTFHRSKTYQRIKVCGRYLHESDARSSGLSQNGRELSEGKEKVL